MANICLTKLTCVGEQEKLNNLLGMLSQGGRFHEIPLSEIIDRCGIEVKDFKGSLRGDFTLVSADSHDIRFYTTTAWQAPYEVMQLLKDKFGVDIYYSAEEPGNCVYETNDKDHTYFPPFFAEIHSDREDIDSDRIFAYSEKQLLEEIENATDVKLSSLEELQEHDFGDGVEVNAGKYEITDFLL